MTDAVILMAYGIPSRPEDVRPYLEDVLRRAGGRPGHVFNLGHGVLPETDPDDLRRLVDVVHKRTSASASADAAHSEVNTDRLARDQPLAN